MHPNGMTANRTGRAAWLALDQLLSRVE